ncbi:P-loop containing nucleoside triphosphate hydrolase protein [Multifurca ochricompacta]|uniref:P-loop containing nucleoside triphosphate hydrolase protein n=1 Tax=Multifurca ochricompacta TaxID=376703 RepID=A0AAD4QLV0_9AGAM|nr:P-loop containing nucleoside triphosphate hydrolase protein [Multifurca ochricompacta]
MPSTVSSSPPSGKCSDHAEGQLHCSQSFRVTESFNHYTLGIWDLYIEKPPIKWQIPIFPLITDSAQFITDLRYLWRAIRDLSSPLLFARLAVSAALALSPAASLWFTGKFLQQVQATINDQELDGSMMIQLTCGRVACSLTQCLLERIDGWLYLAFDDFVKRHYSQYAFEHVARIDVPTFMDPTASQRLDAVSLRYGFCPVGRTVDSLLRSGCSILVLFTQVHVLVAILHEQGIGSHLSFLTCLCHLAVCLLTQMELTNSSLEGLAYAATTRNQDYVKMEGLKQLVSDREHRQEIVANGLGPYLSRHFLELSCRLGNRGGEFWSHFLIYQRKINHTTHLLKWFAGELPEIAFVFIMARNMSNLPMVLAAFTLVQSAAKNLRLNLNSILQQTGDFASQLTNLRAIYGVSEIENQIIDGTQRLDPSFAGISLEFQDVSFQYPGSKTYALRRVSFRVKQGQLCVIVGFNGSGKSTILKLAGRIYDATEGTIRVNGRDIRELKLDDLHRSIAVLFQDYTLFPVSIKDNIALGNPKYATDLELVAEAARLGGADAVIKRLPDGWNTYLSRPDSVHDVIRIQREDESGTIDRTLRQLTGTQPPQGLSGGQQQRIAVARTFMHTLGPDSSVGLLLFDEPSAALDPVAEHDLFSKLHGFRGKRTMVFSTHRFGNLTKYADIIVVYRLVRRYMNETTIVETGTHEELIQAKGDYARLWQLQAEAFR